VSSAYAYRRPVDNTFLVRERDRRRWREALLVVAALLPLGVGLLTYTWVHVEVLDAGYRIQDLEGELRVETRLLRQRRLEASYLASPGLIERRAQEELGMVRPSAERMLFWEEVR